MPVTVYYQEPMDSYSIARADDSTLFPGTRYYICDTEAERPATARSGDRVSLSDGSKSWLRNGSGWVQLTGDASHSIGSHSGFPGGSSTFLRADGIWVTPPSIPAKESHLILLAEQVTF